MKRVLIVECEKDHTHPDSLHNVSQGWSWNGLMGLLLRGHGNAITQIFE